MTLAGVRRKTERIREFSAFPFLLIAAVSAAGALTRQAPPAVTGGPINSGDVAWMLTATGLVLLVKQGPSARKTVLPFAPFLTLGAVGALALGAPHVL